MFTNCSRNRGKRGAFSARDVQFPQNARHERSSLRRESRARGHRKSALLLIASFRGSLNSLSLRSSRKIHLSRFRHAGCARVKETPLDCSRESNRAEASRCAFSKKREIKSDDYDDDKCQSRLESFEWRSGCSIARATRARDAGTEHLTLQWRSALERGIRYVR